MSPLRLLILAALGYILYRLLFGPKPVSPQGAAPPAAAGRPADDLLVEDPICHTYVPQQGAESLVVGGTTYYFCSPECRKKFQSEQR